MNTMLRFLKRELTTLKRIVLHRILISPKTEKDVIDQFHQLYYHSAYFGKTWMYTNWLGVPIQKCPLDLWIYQEIIWELKPDLIIECGTLYGGSALYLASLCELVSHGMVATIDIFPERAPTKPQHDRIKYISGSSTSEDVLQQVAALVDGQDRVMVILDSDHHQENVIAELRSYAKFVTKDSYIIVEDTTLNGHPVNPEFGPGPMEAVDQFLAENHDFAVTNENQKFWLTFNPGGFLRRVR